jgi:hypothetical protein
MTDIDVEGLKQSTHAIFAALYLVDVETLSASQRRDHQSALSAAYLAYVKAENVDLAGLAEPAKLALAGLGQRISMLEKGLQQTDTPATRLELATSNLDVLGQLAYLFGTAN